MELEEKISQILKDVRESPWQGDYMDYNKTYLTECVSHVSLDGLWLEFGVFRGRTITTIAKNTKKTVYGFDSFEGLPEDWDSNNPKGFFSLDGRAPDGVLDGQDMSGFDSRPSKTLPWEKNIKLIKGWFDSSLPEFLKEHEEKVAFIHIDSDLYSSCRTILNNLKNRIVLGTIICFDDFMDYKVNQNNEVKAFAEFLLETGLNYKTLALQTHEPSSIYFQTCFKVVK